MSNSNYTKVSDEMLEDKRFNLADCVIYAKLTYRMKLSVKNDKFFDNGYYVIYKINDLAHDCGVSRNVVINSLKKLCKLGYIVKDRKLFGLRLYLPKFKMTRPKSRSKSSVSHDPKLTSENKDRKINNNNNNYVTCSNRSTVKKANRKYPSVEKMINRFGKRLFDYAVEQYHKARMFYKVNNTEHFIYGILRRWQRKGIKNVNKAMISEHDSRARWYTDDHGPEIPIFKI